jgi:quercetin dioxygenase-like cupin family protein
MRAHNVLPIALMVTVVGAGSIALASHVPEVDPAGVPTGFLTAHTRFDAIRVNSLARAIKPHGTDLFIQHARLAPEQATAWHTHPGPVLVSVRSGSLTYEDAHGDQCRRITYGAGEGFLDPGFGHVHRAIAGPSGAEFYPVYILPQGSAAHAIDAPPPEACRS